MKGMRGLTGAAIAAVGAAAAGVVVVVSSEQAERDRQRTSSQSSVHRPQDCPVTIPNGRTPAGVRLGSDEHGDGRLFTLLGSDGRFVVASTSSPEYLAPDGGIAVDGVLKPDGSVSIKQGWRRGPGVRGRVRVQARRLDAPAARVDRTIPPGGYGLTGFQATNLRLPTVGCWKVTGSVGEAKLTFVTLVLKARAKR
jgi:hypothetical protein